MWCVRGVEGQGVACEGVEGHMSRKCYVCHCVKTEYVGRGK